MVEQGELDAIHGFSGAPVGGLKELAQNQPCQLLKYTQEELEAILAENQSYYPVVIPAGTLAGLANYNPRTSPRHLTHPLFPQ